MELVCMIYNIFSVYIRKFFAFQGFTQYKRENGDEYDIEVPNSCPVRVHGVSLNQFRWQSNDTLGLLLGCFSCMVLAFLMLAMP
jgi:hypothetical protein